MATQQNNGQEQDLNHLRKVRREKLAELQQNGRDPFQITKFNQTHHSLEVKDIYEAHEAEILKDHQQPNVEGMDEEQAKEALKNDYEERRSIMDASPIHVAIAGRMMFKRVMGKASFCNIQDLQGSIQVYVARDAIGTDSYTDFKRSDIGDIFGLEGFAFRTRTGEISIHAEKMTLLSKSLQILPEKFHGLTDTDTRYRQRYVDLIMNPESKETFIKRSKIIKEIRNFLDGRGFMEVETPMLVSNALLPSLIILPHSAIGGFTPSPRKESPASSIIMVPISRTDVTRMGPAILGRICLSRSFPVLLPESFAAIRYAESF